MGVAWELRQKRAALTDRLEQIERERARGHLRPVVGSCIPHLGEIEHRQPSALWRQQEMLAPLGVSSGFAMAQSYRDPKGYDAYFGRVWGNNHSAPVRSTHHGA